MAAPALRTYPSYLPTPYIKPPARTHLAGGFFPPCLFSYTAHPAPQPHSTNPYLTLILSSFSSMGSASSRRKITVAAA